DPLPYGAIARLGSVRFQAVRDIERDNPAAFIYRGFLSTALSPDGTAVVTCYGPRIDFMDTSTGKSRRRFEVPAVGREHMIFTPDGKGLVFHGSSGISLVDAATGQLVNSIDITDANGPIAFTWDGKWIASQARMFVRDASVAIWETRTGKQVTVMP